MNKNGNIIFYTSLLLAPVMIAISTLVMVAFQGTMLSAFGALLCPIGLSAELMILGWFAEVDRSTWIMIIISSVSVCVAIGLPVTLASFF